MSHMYLFVRGFMVLVQISTLLSIVNITKTIFDQGRVRSQQLNEECTKNFRK